MMIILNKTRQKSSKVLLENKQYISGYM